MFNPLQTWSLGPLSLSVEMIFMFAAVIGALAAASYYLKWLGLEEKDSVMDGLTTAMIVAVLVFKFWPFILEPSLLSELSNLIYFFGGPWAVPAAVTAAILVLAGYHFKKKWPLQIWEAVLTAALTGLAIFNLFVRQYGLPSPLPFGFTLEGTTLHPVNFYYAWMFTVVLAGSILLFSKNQAAGRIIYLVASVGVVYYLVSPFTV